jgi:hypothetical protein
MDLATGHARMACDEEELFDYMEDPIYLDPTYLLDPHAQIYNSLCECHIPPTYLVSPKLLSLHNL